MSSKHRRDNRIRGFTCGHCGLHVELPRYGTSHRNHCPYCLHSLHVDNETGDRRSDCRGIMAPIAVWVRDDGEWSLVHRCNRCGFMRTNRIAGDDSEAALLSMAARPIAQLPFPIGAIASPPGAEWR